MTKQLGTTSPLSLTDTDFPFVPIAPSDLNSIGPQPCSPNDLLKRMGQYLYGSATPYWITNPKSCTNIRNPYRTSIAEGQIKISYFECVNCHCSLSASYPKVGDDLKAATPQSPPAHCQCCPRILKKQHPIPTSPFYSCRLACTRDVKNTPQAAHLQRRRLHPVFFPLSGKAFGYVRNTSTPPSQGKYRYAREIRWR
ncbi:hypothetical protein BDZ45DRAFT_669372 [Acephala macrosclerotiorum]|nr:hypothetical protein BDZ45DRAFT_669372 [Acephala macrosclerotiorum]